MTLDLFSPIHLTSIFCLILLFGIARVLFLSHNLDLELQCLSCCLLWTSQETKFISEICFPRDVLGHLLGLIEFLQGTPVDM
jgi:hypothetical protein